MVNKTNMVQGSQWKEDAIKRTQKKKNIEDVLCTGSSTNPIIWFHSKGNIWSHIPLKAHQ